MTDMLRPALLLTLSLILAFTDLAFAKGPDEGPDEGPDPWMVMMPRDEARDDFTALYEKLQSAHYNLFANRTRKEYDARFAEGLSAIRGPVTRYDLLLAMQRFAAYGDVAHARLDFPSEVYGRYREKGGRAFPIYLRIVDGAAFVGEDYSGVEKIAPGDEILSLDGRAMRTWLSRTARNISADTPYIAHSILETTFPMYLWVEVGERASFSLRIKKPNGRVLRVQVPALTYDELTTALEAAPATFELDYSSRTARMLGDGIAYLRPGPFYNLEDPVHLWDPQGFIDFVDTSFELFLEEGAQTLVIDLRNNPGGDNSFSDPIVSWVADRRFRFASRFRVRSSDEAALSNQKRLDADPGAAEGVSGLYAEAFKKTPRGETFDFEIPFAEPRAGNQFKGKVYVLVNRNSYSNAVTTAAIFQDYGWGVIAGEETADFATTYGAMEHFDLPRSGFSVGFPKALIVRPSGDETPGGVVPDLMLESPVLPTSDDAVLAALLTHIAQP